MSRWLFDLGNSRLKCAPLEDDGRPGESIAIAHDGERLDPAALAALPARIGSSFVASVAPAAVREALFDVLRARSGRIEVAATQRRFGALEIAYAQPAQLGVDRFLALLAARARSLDPTLVVGVGTALTIDWLAADGRHRGGRIAPSPSLMRATLHARAAQLPPGGGSYAEFGAATDDALASGCIGAALALVERSMHAASAGGPAPRLLVHGGGGAELLPHLRGAVDAPALVLEGLAQWAMRADGGAD